MNSWIETITITLFLFLGVNVFAITHVDSAEVQIEAARECPVKGQVYLRLNGTLKNGQLYGWVNNESVYLSVFSGRVTGFINDHSVLLTMKDIGHGEYSLVGWISTQRINWRSVGGTFNEWINCY